MTFLKKIKYSLFVTGFLILLIIPKVVRAEGIGFSVKGIIPENQIDKSQTYFDLLVKPGATQNIELELTNSSDKELSLVVEPHVDSTNQNGELEFSEEPKKYDSSLLYPITKLLSEKQTVKIPGKETKKVTFSLKMPKEELPGKLVGAFNIYDEDNSKDEKNKGAEDVQIKNIYSVALGIQLRQNLETVKPDLKLNQVKAGLFNYRTAITANLQNIKPEFIGDMNVSAQVRKRGAKEVLFETEKSGMTMAPNSNFDFPISMGNQEIKSGKYELDIKAKSKDNKWTFHKKFTITDEEARKFNDEAVEKEETKKDDGIILKVFLILLMVAAVIGTIIFIFVFSRR